MTPRLLVAGVFERSDAYPNVKYKVDIIREIAGESYREIHLPVRSKLNYSSKITTIYSLFKYVFELTSKSLVAVIKIARFDESYIIYIPYPSTFVLFLYSLIPLKPRRILVSDLFISVYDTVVEDRRLISKKSILARLLKWGERVAINQCVINLVDTPENADYYASLFAVERNRFSYVPLAINESVFYQSEVGRECDQTDRVKVIFVGTLVPLHNVGALCDAIERISPRKSVEFTFVGVGQESCVLERFFSAHNWADNIVCHWIKEWQSSNELFRLIAKSDLCIGILGSDGKSQRVWPYKNYLYMACGKPIFTGNSPVARRLQLTSGYSSFVTVDSVDSDGMARELGEIIDNTERRTELARNASMFYESEFSHQTIKAILKKLIVDYS